MKTSIIFLMAILSFSVFADATIKRNVSPSKITDVNTHCGMICGDYVVIDGVNYARGYDVDIELLQAKLQEARDTGKNINIVRRKKEGTIWGTTKMSLDFVLYTPSEEERDEEIIKLNKRIIQLQEQNEKMRQKVTELQKVIDAL